MFVRAGSDSSYAVTHRFYAVPNTIPAGIPGHHGLGEVLRGHGGLRESLHGLGRGFSMSDVRSDMQVPFSSACCEKGALQWSPKVNDTKG